MRAARHPADFDGRPTAGAQVLARVPMVPWHPYRSGPALHCRVLSRSESCSLSKSDRHFFVVVASDWCDLAFCGVATVLSPAGDSVRSVIVSNSPEA